MPRRVEDIVTRNTLGHGLNPNATCASSQRPGSKLPGKPDFVFPKLKTALFVDGCFSLRQAYG